MKVSLLLLVAALAYVQGAVNPTEIGNLNLRHVPWIKGKCQKKVAKDNFKPEKYFQGTWYGRFIYHDLLNLGSNICYGTAYSDIVDNAVHFLHWNFDSKFDVNKVLLGKVFLDEVKNSTYIDHFDDLNGEKNATIKYTVVNTDYKNYAVTYYCHEKNGYKLEALYGLTRKLGDKKHDKNIYTAIRKTKIPKSKLLNAGKCVKKPVS